MKLVALTSAALLAATTAFAGNFAPVEVMEEAVMTETAPSGSLGGSGAWLVPVIAIALVALAVSQSDDD